MRYLLAFLLMLSFAPKSNAALLSEYSSTSSLRNENVGGIYSPIFNAEDNIRHKKAFSISLGLIYQLNDYNLMNVTYKNTSNVGLTGELALNFTSKFWGKLNLEGVLMVKDSGTFVGVAPGSGSGFSTSGANAEIKAVVGYDFLSYKNIDISAYGGLYEKALVNTFNPDGQSSLSFNSNYVGAVYGTGLTHYTEKFVTNVYAEGYLTYLNGNVSVGVNTQKAGNFTSSSPAAGFGIGASTEILIAQNLWIKPFAKFQMMFSSNLVNSAGTNVGSTSNFMATTFGLALSWR